MTELVTVRRHVVPHALADAIRVYLQERRDDVHWSSLHLALLNYADAIDYARMDASREVKPDRGAIGRLLDKVGFRVITGRRER